MSVWKNTQRMARIAAALGPVDALAVRRDSMYTLMFAAPILMAVGARWLFPVVFVAAEQLTGLPLMPYYQAFMSFFVAAMAPFFVGAVVGFLLLDQRDDGVLTAIATTPVRVTGYLVYRLLGPALASMAIAAVALPLSGLTDLTWGQSLLVAASSAPLAPIMALVVATVAENKVQGMAVMKADGVILLPPLAAYFWHSPWNLVCGLSPVYWPAQTLWTLVAGGAHAWMYAVGGWVFQALLLAGLVWLFIKKRIQ